MRKISLLLTLCLLTLTLSACASSPTDWGAISLGRRDVATDTPIEGETVAAAVSVTAPLGGMEISFDVTGEDAEITVSIYKAEKDYNTTCSQKPLREETFSHLTENLLWQFKTLPAGDYLIVFTDANNAALLKSIVPSDAANRKILNYRNGEVMTDGTCAITLLCIKTTEIPEPGLVTFAYPVIQE